MKILDRNKLKVGDTVGVPYPIYRNDEIIPMTVKRITPAKTKIVMSNDHEFGRDAILFEMDEECMMKMRVTECAKNIYKKIDELNQEETCTKLFSVSDEVIITVSNLLDEVMEALTKTENKEEQ